MKKTYYRAIWIGDAHLFTRDCQVGYLRTFLKSVKCDYLYIVGDFIDLWQLKRRWYWPREFNGIIRRILKMADKGAKVVYIPGNHDEVLRDFVEYDWGAVQIRAHAVHITADGRKLLVLHGDEFDTVVQCHKWMAHLGAFIYDYLIILNRMLNSVRRAFSLPYWSLSGAIKRKVKHAVDYMTGFEEAAVREAKRRGLHGVVCGHIHQPSAKIIRGTEYYNVGDWVESCTALTEAHDGTMRLIKFADVWQTDDPNEWEQERGDAVEADDELQCGFTAQVGFDVRPQPTKTIVESAPATRHEAETGKGKEPHENTVRRL
jgi:UDP-2,3-diacylglucosamine pyrophosphatase LpxH